MEKIDKKIPEKEKIIKSPAGSIKTAADTHGGKRRIHSKS